MSVRALADYTVYSKYSHYLKDQKRRETWKEAIDRVFDMHERRYAAQLEASSELRAEIDFAKSQVLKKRVLGSQRVLQFGGEWAEKHNAKVYNCAFTYADRPRAFQEIMYLLLCGCGVGFSVQGHHVAKLPSLSPRRLPPKTFVVEDSIEGWADAVGVAVASHCQTFEGGGEAEKYRGRVVKFDLSQIRPAGTLIAGRFKAPGPEGLENSLAMIDDLISMRKEAGETRLHPIDVYDILMHAADAVLSGGVRRSASIALFSPDDQEMLEAKTGNWRDENGQRGRSNNSAVLVRGEVTAEQFQSIMARTKEFGEPGFLFVDDKDHGTNPCVEIGLFPRTADGRSGVQFCNLCEINGKLADNEEKFYAACRAAAIIGTLQAGYTNFKYLSDESREITEKEALLGCSITGIMDNPETLLNPKIQRKGAQQIVEVNTRIAKLLGINPAARTTCVKPAGTTSCVLQTASGIHPHHSARYIRRTQANKAEWPAQHFKEVNPLSVEESVWSAAKSDYNLLFLCEVPKGAILKNDLGAIELLERVKLTQQSWVRAGRVDDRCSTSVSHNVSNTITVRDDEWKEVQKFLFRNRNHFTGVALLSHYGDLDYPQAPFNAVLTPTEIIREYGDAGVLASGLVVDGLDAFDGDLWRACGATLGQGEDLASEKVEPVVPQKNGYTDRQYTRLLLSYYQKKDEYDEWFYKWDWMRRCRQFAERYFEDDLRRCTYCLKHVHLWHKWLELQRNHSEIDWSTVKEEDETFQNADELGAQACAGGKCDL